MHKNNKTIICIYGRENEGKSQTIIKLTDLLKRNFQIGADNLIFSGDKLHPTEVIGTLTINNIIIGFESQGDPGGRMMTEDTLHNLAEEKKCSIIICAARTRGQTNHKIDKIAEEFDFNTLWLSSFYSPKLNFNTLNNLAAENLLRIIQQLITDGDLYLSQQ